MMKKQTRGGRINRINPQIHQIIAQEFLRSSNPNLNKARECKRYFIKSFG